MSDDKIIITPSLKNEKTVELELVNDLLKDHNLLKESDVFYYLWAVRSIQCQTTNAIKFADVAVVSSDFFTKALYRDSFYFINELNELKDELEKLCGDSYTLNKHEKCFKILKDIIENLEFEFKNEYETNTQC